MRRKFVFAVPLIIAVFLFGCGGGNDSLLDPGNPVTLAIWHFYHGPQQRAFEQAVAEFNNTVGLERGIIVSAYNRGNVTELAENVTAAALGELDAGDMPDIFLSHGDTALRILNMGLVTEICGYLTQEQLDEYVEAFIRFGMIGTEYLYIFPIAQATELLLVDINAFNSFAEGLAREGFTETVSIDDFGTWEGISRMAGLYYLYNEAVTGSGKTFLGIDGRANYIITGAKQLGAEIVTINDGVVSINVCETALSRVWYNYYENAVRGRFGRLGRFSSDDVKTGDLLAYIGSSTSVSFFPVEREYMDGSTSPVEMLALPVPVFDNHERVAILQGAGLVVARSTEQREYASVVFLRWFTESYRNVEFALRSGYIPVRTASLDAYFIEPAFAEIEADGTDLIAMNVAAGMRVAIAQLANYTFYSSPPFDGGFEFRGTLPVMMEQAARADRQRYIEKINDGIPPDEAFLILYEESRGLFYAWLDVLRGFAQ